MPIAFLFTALCSGLIAAAIWLTLGGSGLMAFGVYVLSGHLAMAALLSHAAMRGFR